MVWRGLRRWQFLWSTNPHVYRSPMTNRTIGLRLRLDAARLWWHTDYGAVPIREAIAILAVAIIVVATAVAALEVAGFDVAGWLREQFGIAG